MMSVYAFCCESESIMAPYVLDIGTMFCLIREAVRYFAAFYLAEFPFLPIGKAVTNSATFLLKKFWKTNLISNRLNLSFPGSFQRLYV